MKYSLLSKRLFNHSFRGQPAAVGSQTADKASRFPAASHPAVSQPHLAAKPQLAVHWSSQPSAHAAMTACLQSVIVAASRRCSCTSQPERTACRLESFCWRRCSCQAVCIPRRSTTSLGSRARPVLSLGLSGVLVTHRLSLSQRKKIRFNLSGSESTRRVVSILG